MLTALPAAFLPPPLAIPTSAVRTTGPPWPDYPPSWQDGPYYQSPHYRPHTSGYHTGHSPSLDASASTSRNTSSQPPNAEDTLGIDPALDDDGGPHLTAADVVAAVRAVLLQAESEEKAKRQREEEEQRLLLEQEEMDGGYDSMSLRRPEPMEHILTEDGEPMLNPGASLLYSRGYSLILCNQPNY